MRKGSRMTPAQRRRVSEGQRGKTLTAEHRRKIGLGLKRSTIVRDRKGRPPGVSATSREWVGFRDQRNAARTRGIPFLLTFDEWLTIWRRSRRWKQRGRRGYVMARFNDEGPYAVGNVQIVTSGANTAEAHTGRSPTHQQTKTWQAQHSKAMQRWARKPGVRAMLSEAGKRGAAARWR